MKSHRRKATNAASNHGHRAWTFDTLNSTFRAREEEGLKMEESPLFAVANISLEDEPSRGYRIYEAGLQVPYTFAYAIGGCLFKQ